MSITDKCRKLLWGRSGNQCAMCKIALAVEKTASDSDSIVGDECHIVSASPIGPRHRSDYPSNQFDDYENLIVLCKVHHKLVDDQPQTFSEAILRQLKSNHEQSVAAKLSEDQSRPKPVRLVRSASQIPKRLDVVKSGQALIAQILASSGSYTQYPDGLGEDDRGLIKELFGWIEDLGWLGDDLTVEHRIDYAANLQEIMDKLAARSMLVFAASETQTLTGGIGHDQRFGILHISVGRIGDPNIIITPPQSVPSSSQSERCIVDCPGCKGKARVPRTDGLIRVKCPTCEAKYEVRNGMVQ